MVKESEKVRGINESMDLESMRVRSGIVGFVDCGQKMTDGKAEKKSFKKKFKRRSGEVSRKGSCIVNFYEDGGDSAEFVAEGGKEHKHRGIC